MQKIKKVPQRMCIACREMKDKQDLIRFVKTSNGEITLDKTGKLAGRGAYVCNNLDCVKKCIKTHALNRVYSSNIDASVYERLMREYGEDKQD